MVRTSVPPQCPTEHENMPLLRSLGGRAVSSAALAFPVHWRTRFAVSRWTISMVPTIQRFIASTIQRFPTLHRFTPLTSFVENRI